MLGVLLAAALTIATPEEAVALLSADPPPDSKETFESAKTLIAGAAAKEPDNNRWKFGRALVLFYSGKELEARDIFEEVAKAEPNRSDYQYFYGASVFESIDEVGMLGKMSAASKGKAALEKAITLDPSNLRARQGVFQYYLEAPAIAGGSTAKAKEQAQAAIALPGGAGAYRGQMMLAQLALEDEDWAAMSKAYTAAETAGGNGANPTAAMTTHAFQLIRAKKDPAAALPVIDRLAKIAKPEDSTVDFLRGEAQSAMDNCSAAVDSYNRVLAKQPDAPNSRFALATCLEKLGRHAEAASHFEEFAKRFPKDDRAAKAKGTAAKLRKT